jgi:hypothetical protein
MLEHVSPNAFYAPYLKTPWLNYRQPFMISTTQAEQDSKGKDERTDALSDLAMKTQQIKLLSEINQNLKYLQNQNATIINMLVQMFQSKK